MQGLVTRVQIALPPQVSATKDMQWLQDNLKEHLGFTKMGAFLVILLVGGTYYFASAGGNSSSSNSQNTNSGVAAVFNGAFPNSETNSVCRASQFEPKDWTIRYYKTPNDSGFYCPKNNSAFSSPDIWYKESVPLQFKSLTASFQLINENGKSKYAPSLIFSLGDSLRILRFYAPHGKNAQIVGFEKIALEDPDNKLKFEAPRNLSEPMKYGTQIEITVRSLLLGDNHATFAFQLKYISTSGNDVEDNFNYDVDLPIPNSDNSPAVKFGFGTLEGNCIKPIEYNFCY